MEKPKSLFIPGQRWISESEPELGLGTILEVGFRDVKIRFEAAGETRVYMQRNAPLRRVQLQPGDRARGRNGELFVVQAVREHSGMITYHGADAELSEGELLDQMAFSDPDKRLLAGKVGKPREFSLRYRTLEFRRAMLGLRVRGLAGARIELLPHQIGIAHEISGRHHPRILLADEVGLGKTIEAGLVFHRLMVTGQIQRVLIVTPSQLVHQWMVELYRRFNHMFTVLDEDLYRSEEKGKSDVNSFSLRQTTLCATDFLSSSQKRVEQALSAGIDLLIVDEAHHLGWSPDYSSPEYLAIEQLAQAAKSVLLLTATPIQLGQAGHFGRLRLLDPNRFNHYEKYLEETVHYQKLAELIEPLLVTDTPQPQVIAGLQQTFANDTALQLQILEYSLGKPGSRQQLLDDLVDRHGTGRLMFRNRRQAMGGFPKRVVNPVALEPSPETLALVKFLKLENQETILVERDLNRFLGGAPMYLAKDLGGMESESSEFLRVAWRRDSRLIWLVEFIKEHPTEKILLICAHKAMVFALQEILPTLTTVNFTSFHENLAMTTRDKNAAYFSQPDGAQLLLCSEIGSEGRNFQFASHLILFDLPLDPSILEQRIGRLDRIGQKNDVQIHVPYFKGLPQETVFRWYHEGLDALRKTVLGADTFHELLIEKLLSACAATFTIPLHASATELIAETKSVAATVRETLEKGRDRLLEINSNKAELATGLIRQIRIQDSDVALENYLDEVFDHFGLDVEKANGERSYFVFPGERMLLDSFPGISESGLTITYDRAEALAREEVTFMTIDHPLVRGAVDLLLESQEGTVGFVEWSKAPVKGMALEAIFILETTAPGYLHLDRFFPPTPIRVMVDDKGESLNHLFKLLDSAQLDMAQTGILEEQHENFDRLVPKWLETARRNAAIKESLVKKEAHSEAETILSAECRRLRALQSLNNTVSQSEVDLAEEHLATVLNRIKAAELRLDSVRLVLLGKSRF